MRGGKKVNTKRVYAVVSSIPRGRVSTYGAVARAIGSPRAARAIGSLMRTNPNPPTIPCHRVVYSDARLGGFSGRAKVAVKEKLLRSEGIIIVRGRIKNFSEVFFDPRAPRGSYST